MRSSACLENSRSVDNGTPARAICCRAPRRNERSSSRLPARSLGIVCSTLRKFLRSDVSPVNNLLWPRRDAVYRLTSSAKLPSVVAMVKAWWLIATDLPSTNVATHVEFCVRTFSVLSRRTSPTRAAVAHARATIAITGSGSLTVVCARRQSVTTSLGTIARGKLTSSATLRRLIWVSYDFSAFERIIGARTSAIGRR